MKHTAFHHLHEKMGGKMVDFAGFHMPVEFAGVTKEHIQVRQSVGVFDVSHMGEIWIKGPKAKELVQYITSNNIEVLTPGKAQYSCFPNGKGGIVDDLIVYDYEPQKYMLVVNASNIEKDYNWILEQNKNIGAQVENASDNISQLAIQGPKAIDVLQKLTDVNLSQIEFYTFTTGKMAGVDDVIISATGYTGAGGFELYFYNQHADKIWDAIFEAGKEFDIQPIGLAARDTLRLEMGYCLYGNDIDDSTSPIEAGLGWITKFTDDNNFVDKELLLEQKNAPIQRRLKGFTMIDRGIPRKGYSIVDAQGNKIGTVTSGTMSPMLKTGIGMGYVNAPFHKKDTEIYIQIRNKNLKAKISPLPFYKAS